MARGQTLITGSDRVLRQGGRVVAYNSLYLFGPGGALPLVYDKFHLVPFGEYVPFARFLNRLGITQLVVGEDFPPAIIRIFFRFPARRRFHR